MKILVIDDQTLIREGLALLLRQMDSTVTTIASDTLAHAIHVLGEQSDIDAVLLDVDASGIESVEALSRARSFGADLPVVVLCAKDDAETVYRALQAGARGFIPKQHSAQLMIGALDLVVRRKGIYVPPSVLPKSVRTERVQSESGDDQEVRQQGSSDFGMTPKQAQVLRLLLEGKSNKAIARSLGVEPGTIKIHVSAVLRALQVATRTEAMVRARELSLLPSV